MSIIKINIQPRLSVHVIFKVSLVANVPEPVEKFAICGIVPTDEALNVADANTDVNAPDAVNVCSIVVLLVPALWVFVVASARCKPFVDISPVRVVFAAAGVIEDSVDAIKPAPLVPADVFVYTCACIQSRPASVKRLCFINASCSGGCPCFLTEADKNPCNIILLFSLALVTS